MISIICVYNNQKILEKYLLNGLEYQSNNFELILIDNTDNKYKSASTALNEGAKKANGSYFMFVHQDVDLSSNMWLEDVEKVLKSLNNLGIAGVAGVTDNGQEILSNIENGIPPKPVGQIRIKYPTNVQTLDECLVIIPKNVFDKYKFDEELKDWHLYSVDYCLNIKKQGFGVYVIPEFVYHKSFSNSLPKNYYGVLKKIMKKYKKDYNKIYTTCGVWNTSYPMILYKVLRTIYSYYNKIKDFQ
jgi:GT2 family glycosyltransferase